MLRIRQSTPDDIDALLVLSAKTGQGMTSMPQDRENWVEKLQRSQQDFNKPTETPNSDIYFMVLEDVVSKAIVGCSALYPGIGIKKPFYTYKLSTITQSSDALDITISSKLLSLVNDYSGCTELGSLFILPEYRKSGVGQFLSRSRFMLIADFPERFDAVIFAEVRGYLDDNEESPFWEHLAAKFFGLSYERANFINAVDGTQFIADLMPKYPIYLDLLPKEAQEVVGKPNNAAKGAVRILQKEGLQYTGYVDIFDAGPCLQNHVDQLKTVVDSRLAKVVDIISDDVMDAQQADQYIISNGQIQNYRIVARTLQCRSEDTVVISQSTAQDLDVVVGGQVRYVQF